MGHRRREPDLIVSGRGGPALLHDVLLQRGTGVPDQGILQLIGQSLGRVCMNAAEQQEECEPGFPCRKSGFHLLVAGLPPDRREAALGVDCQDWHDS